MIYKSKQEVRTLSLEMERDKLNVIVVCGSPWSDLESLFGAMCNAGISPETATAGSFIPSMATFHDRYFALQNETRRQLRPGKAWEQAAASIFLANCDKPLWGWADCRSTWLLDYWREFDPQIGFLLIYTDPAFALARALADPSKAELDAQGFVASWIGYNQEILRFFHRNRDRCTLIDLDECKPSPLILVQALEDSLNLVFERELSFPAAQSSQENAVALLLATDVLKDFPEALELKQEIKASLSHSCNIADTPVSSDGGESLPLLHQAITELKELFYQAGPLAKAAEAELHTLRTELESSNRKFEELRQTSAEELRRINDSLENEKKVAVQELREENELLLLQLHQVQEELEKHFLQYQAETQKSRQLEERNAQLQSETKQRAEELKHQQAQLQTAEKARDEQAKLAASRLAELEKLKSKTIELEKHLLQDQAETQKSRQLEERNAQLQSETKQRAEELKHQQAQLQTAEKARDEQAKLAASRLAELEKLKSKTIELEKQYAQEKQKLQTETHVTIEELKQENELLLLQLHQVQEELENYFLKFQDAQNNSTGHESRWQRMLSRHPDLCDWKSVEALTQEELKTGPAVRWRIEGLTVGNRVLPEFEASTMVRGGHPALVIQRSGDQHPLLRWPAIARSQQALVLQPTGVKQDHNVRLGILCALATNDLQCARAIGIAICEHLRGSDLKLAEQVKPSNTFWISQLEAWTKALGHIPVTFRYDTVRLKHEQVNPDYEHLWFVLENAEFGKRHWPRFEFRLSAASVTPGGFSLYPKLEFPKAEDGSKQFENWFAESEDDLGPKYELRFALEKQEMDLKAWGALSATDQIQMTLLAGGLQNLLSSLESGGATISRPWKEWQHLAQQTYVTLMKNIQTVVEPEPPAAEPEVAETVIAAPTQSSPNVKAAATSPKTSKHAKGRHAKGKRRSA